MALRKKPDDVDRRRPVVRREIERLQQLPTGQPKAVTSGMQLVFVHEGEGSETPRGRRQSLRLDSSNRFFCCPIAFHLVTWTRL